MLGLFRECQPTHYHLYVKAGGPRKYGSTFAGFIWYLKFKWHKACAES